MLRRTLLAPKCAFLPGAWLSTTAERFSAIKAALESPPPYAAFDLGRIDGSRGTTNDVDEFFAECPHPPLSSEAVRDTYEQILLSIEGEEDSENSAYQFDQNDADSEKDESILSELLKDTKGSANAAAETAEVEGSIQHLTQPQTNTEATEQSAEAELDQSIPERLEEVGDQSYHLERMSQMGIRSTEEAVDALPRFERTRLLIQDVIQNLRDKTNKHMTIEDALGAYHYPTYRVIRVLGRSFQHIFDVNEMSTIFKLSPTRISEIINWTDAQMDWISLNHYNERTSSYGIHPKWTKEQWQYWWKCFDAYNSALERLETEMSDCYEAWKQTPEGKSLLESTEAIRQQRTKEKERFENLPKRDQYRHIALQDPFEYYIWPLKWRGQYAPNADEYGSKEWIISQHLWLSDMIQNTGKPANLEDPLTILSTVYGIDIPLTSAFFQASRDVLWALRRRAALAAELCELYDGEGERERETEKEEEVMDRAEVVASQADPLFFRATDVEKMRSKSRESADIFDSEFPDFVLERAENERNEPKIRWINVPADFKVNYALMEASTHDIVLDDERGLLPDEEVEKTSLEVDHILASITEEERDTMEMNRLLSS